MKTFLIATTMMFAAASANAATVPENKDCAFGLADWLGVSCELPATASLDIRRDGGEASPAGNTVGKSEADNGDNDGPDCDKGGPNPGTGDNASGHNGQGGNDGKGGKGRDTGKNGDKGGKG